MAPGPSSRGFDQNNEAVWRERVERILRGASFDTLDSPTYDGLSIPPVCAEAEPAVFPTRNAGPWLIATRIDHPGFEDGLAQGRIDLANGADRLDLTTTGSPSAFGFGVQLSQPGLAARFCDGLGDSAHLSLDCGRLDGDSAAAIVGDWTRAASNAGVDIDLLVDPLALDGAGDSSKFAEAVLQASERGRTGRCFCADARRIHSAGGSEAQELACALAGGLAWLRLFESNGRDPQIVAPALAFRLGADADQFLVVAKIRALRALWARVEASCGFDPSPIFIHAETSWRMMTRRAPMANALRTTIAATAAALGGADAITILPFAQALGLPDADARRLARNAQLILLRECGLDAVVDPGAGAWPIERLTGDLCAAAWRVFQDIERRGGLRAALESGWLQGEIGRVRRARQRDVARRAKRIVGVSEFPELDEADVATGVGLPSAFAPKTSDDGLTPYRDAAPFEHLRDRSDAIKAKVGARPRVFLAALGAASDCAEAISLAANLFESGGIEALQPIEPAQINSTAARFAESGARLACLCLGPGADVESASQLARKLAGAGARRVYCAGDAEREGASGERITADCDALDLLDAAYAAIGTAA